MRRDSYDKFIHFDHSDIRYNRILCGIQTMNREAQPTPADSSHANLLHCIRHSESDTQFYYLLLLLCGASLASLFKRNKIDDSSREHRRTISCLFRTSRFIAVRQSLATAHFSRRCFWKFIFPPNCCKFRIAYGRLISNESRRHLGFSILGFPCVRAGRGYFRAIFSASVMCRRRSCRCWHRRLLSGGGGHRMHCVRVYIGIWQHWKHLYGFASTSTTKRLQSD